MALAEKVELPLFRLTIGSTKILRPCKGPIVRRNRCTKSGKHLDAKFSSFHLSVWGWKEELANVRPHVVAMQQLLQQVSAAATAEGADSDLPVELARARSSTVV